MNGQLPDNDDADDASEDSALVAPFVEVLHSEYADSGVSISISDFPGMGS